MATDKTKLTELATAAGLVHDPSAPWPSSLEDLAVPGIDDEVWKPVVVPHTAVHDPHKELLLRSLANGRAFRRTVLRGRLPELIVWTGPARSVWTSDIPRDLTIDDVFFVQAKYDSSCVLNTSPGSLVDSLLAEHGVESRLSWFEEVALAELQSYYERARAGAPLDPLPRDVRDLDRGAKDVLKRSMRGRPTTTAEDDAYVDLCRAVSIETTLRWRHRLDASTSSQRTQMLFRMLRIAGGPYWVLGARGSDPIQLRVTDTRTWRERFELKRFRVVDAHAGQPQVNWRAEIVDRSGAERHVVDGYCEIRWSHGKLQGHPECKVQVTTPLAAIPGYDPMT